MVRSELFFSSVQLELHRNGSAIFFSNAISTVFGSGMFSSSKPFGLPVCVLYL